MTERQTFVDCRMKFGTRRGIRLEESTGTQERIAESQATVIAEAIGDGGRYRVQLINPGWGSSGHYSADVLAEAATRRVFPAGLHMYANHPTTTEEADRPERDVRDLWAVLATDATVDEHGALIAEAQVFAPYRPLLDEMRDAIGLSIRGGGTFEVGEAEGRQGRIITSIDVAESVDFVTAAGRGGRILELIESARHMAEAGTLDSDRREALRDAVTDAHGTGQDTYAWVRDYDDTLVYFERQTPDGSGLFAQSYAIADDGTASLSGDPVEVVVHTEYVPVSPAGQSTTTTETTEVTMPQIEEARLRQLEADAGRVQTLESERTAADERATQAETALAERDRRDAARPVIAEAFTGSTLQAATVARITESLLVDPPSTDAGELDSAALTTTATAARTSAEAEIAGYLAEAGVGRPRGLGGTTTPDGEVTREKTDAVIAETFGRTPTTQTKEA